MRISMIVLLAIGFGWNFCSGGRANDPERAPIVNAVGRYWGFGYSAGYHARYESRFGWVRYVPDQGSSHSRLQSTPHAYTSPPADTMHFQPAFAPAIAVPATASPAAPAAPQAALKTRGVLHPAWPAESSATTGDAPK